MEDATIPQPNEQLDKVIDKNTENKTAGVGGYVFWGLADHLSQQSGLYTLLPKKEFYIYLFRQWL